MKLPLWSFPEAVREKFFLFTAKSAEVLLHFLRDESLEGNFFEKDKYIWIKSCFKE